jgi:hypothetical protein
VAIDFQLIPWPSLSSLTCRALYRRRLAPAVALGGGGQKRVELGLVEEADVRIVARHLRLVGRPAWVFARPPLPVREVKHAVQEADVVARALDRLTGREADEDEIVNIVFADPGDRLLAEERRDMDPEVALVPRDRRDLPALRRELLNLIRRAPASAIVIRPATGGTVTSLSAGAAAPRPSFWSTRPATPARGSGQACG